jgi:hypothetical protein
MREILTSDPMEEARARRAARCIGLMACKSRCRFHHLDNYGGFMLVDPYRNAVVAGERFELSAEDVIALCARSL